MGFWYLSNLNCRATKIRTSLHNLRRLARAFAARIPNVCLPLAPLNTSAWPFKRGLLRILVRLLPKDLKIVNIKVSKGAKIGNGYNQVPHLTEDTNGKVTNSQLDTTNESQEESPFPAGPGPKITMSP